MQITIKGFGTVDTTATTTAVLVSEGHDVWATAAQWKRINKAMRKHGLTYCDVTTITPADCGTENCINTWWHAMLDEYEFGAVEALWEELEVLGLVAEWDWVEQDWDE